MNPSRRSRPPKVRFPNVERRDKGGVFVFRARLQHLGRTEVGPWRTSQREAFADVEGLRAALARRNPRGPVSIIRALAAVVWDGRKRCLERITVRRQLLCHARWWCQWWEEEDPLELLTEAELSYAVREALTRGRSPNTLREKDLPLLDRAFRLAGLQSPVPAVRSAFRVALKPRRQLVAVLRLEDLRRILHAMRHGEFTHKLRGRHVVTDLAARDLHADLVELLAITGIRSGELARLKTSDFSLASRILRIPIPKDRSNPRVVPVPTASVLTVQRLIAQAAPDGRVVPGGMAFVSCALARWAKRLDEPRLNARALRHFYATELCRRGAPLPSVRDAMGHRSLETTNRYAHGLIDPLRETVAGLGAALSGGAAAGQAPAEVQP